MSNHASATLFLDALFQHAALAIQPEPRAAPTANHGILQDVPHVNALKFWKPNEATGINVNPGLINHGLLIRGVLLQ